MWFTLFMILVGLIVVPLGLGLLLLGLVIVLPIHVGGSGSYRSDGYAVDGWAKILAGLVGVVFSYTETGGQTQVVLGRWVIWQPKEAQAEEGTAPTPPDMSPQAPPSDPVVAASSKPSEDTSARVASAEEPRTFKASEEPNNRVKSPTPKTRVSEGSSPSIALPSPTDEDPGDAPSFWTRWRRLHTQVRRYLDYWQEAQPILWRFVKRLMRIIGFRHLSLDVTYGANDPALTGRLFGYVEAVRPLLGKHTEVCLTPDFTQSRLEGAGAVEISFYLARLCWALLALVVRGGILGAKIWWRERQAKRVILLEEL